ncbi:MAG TPA: winged helix DNA-binding domain-containing protein [Ktedonobacterales bacterium]
MTTNIAQQRLVNQRIEGEKCATAEEVVRWMGAMQAQDYGQALWAIGLRMRAATVADVERAIAEGKILRTWPMRGTLHFVPAEDAKWMVTLSAERMIAGDRRRLEQLELDAMTIGRAEEALCDALEGGKRLTRPDVMRLWEAAGISTMGQRGYHLLWHIAQRGVICVGPMLGKQQTFALLDEWAPSARELAREEALAELANRYFASHGPATLQDVAGWAGLTVTDARAGLEGAKSGSGLVAERREGQEYMRAAAEAPGVTADTMSSVHLLPGFDEYLLGYKDRSAVLAAEHAEKVVPGGNGMFLPMVVVEGQVAGTWKRTVRKNGVDIALKPFVTLGDGVEGINRAAMRYSAFLGVPLASTVVVTGNEAL